MGLLGEKVVLGAGLGGGWGVQVGLGVSGRLGELAERRVEMGMRRCAEMRRCGDAWRCGALRGDGDGLRARTNASCKDQGRCAVAERCARP